MRAIFLYLLIFCWSASVVAQNQTSFPVGEYWQFQDARTLGMAGSGSISNITPGALLENPSALLLGKSVLEIQVTENIRNLEERRSFPIYNRIDDITQKGIYAINDHWFSYFQGGVKLRTQLGGIPVAAAVGVFNEFDLNYRYDEQVRENIFGDALIAINKIRYEGRVLRYALGGALQPTEGLRLGFHLGILKGDLSSERGIVFLDNSSNDVSELKKYYLNNTPLVFNLGITYDLNPHLRVGSHLKLPYSMEYRVTSNSSQTTTMERVEYPFQLTGALEYQARQELRARLNIDVTYLWWSKTESQFQSENFTTLNFDDAFVIKTGVEHIFHNKIPFRVGVQFRSAYQNRNSSRTLLTAGTGFMNTRWRVDVSGGVSNLTYTFPDLFDDTLYGGDRSQSPIDDVEEHYFFGMLTLTLNLGK